MNIFQLIKSGEDFSHLLNEKTILSTKKNKEIEYNPLTYCMEQENKDTLFQTLLSESIMKNFSSSFHNNNTYTNIVLENFNLSEKQESFFLNVVVGNLRFHSNNLYSFEKIHQYIPLKEISKYEEIKKLKDSVGLFNEFHKDIIKTDFNFYSNQFKEYIKEYIKEYSLYHPYKNMSANDKNIENLKSIVETVDSLVLKANSKDDYDTLFSKTLSELINAEYQACQHKDIFFAKSRNTIYLKNNEYLNKLQFYRSVVNSYNQSQDCADILECVFKKEFLEQRREINVPRLDALFSEKKLKSLTIDKDADLERVIKIISEGSKHVEEIYDLRPQDVGGEKLRLEFTYEKSSQNGVAGLTPGADLITYYLSHKDDIGHRHFVHEYSHYIQDQKYRLSNYKGYDETSKHMLDNDKHWNPIQDAISNTVSSKEDLLEYSTNSIKDILKEMSREDFQTFMNVIESNLNNPDTNNYKNKLIYSLTPLLGEKTQLWGETHYRGKSGLISEYKIDNLLDELSIIHKAHHSSSFLSTLWEELDKKRGDNYYSNPMEIHSRLNEKLTNIKINPDEFIRYPTDNLMKKINPNLVEFNKMLASHYEYFVLPIEYTRRHKPYPDFRSENQSFKFKNSDDIKISISKSRSWSYSDNNSVKIK